MQEPVNLPDTFVPYPTNRVTAVIQEVDKVQAALQDLSEAGFGDVWYGTGEETVKHLDIKGEHHGPAARFWRFLQRLTEEHDQLEHYLAEVEKGHFLLAVKLREPKDKEAVRDILKSHDAYYLHYLAPATTESLS